MSEIKYNYGREADVLYVSFISFARMMEVHRDRPLTIELSALRNLPEDLWQAVMAVLTSPPVSDFLSVGLAVAPQVPPLPELTVA